VGLWHVMQLGRGWLAQTCEQTWKYDHYPLSGSSFQKGRNQVLKASHQWLLATYVVAGNDYVRVRMFPVPRCCTSCPDVDSVFQKHFFQTAEQQSLENVLPCMKPVGGNTRMVKTRGDQNVKLQTVTLEVGLYYSLTTQLGCL
jgi:hypothetical protein